MQYQYSLIWYPVQTGRGHSTGVYMLLTTTPDTLANLRNGSLAKGAEKSSYPQKSVVKPDVWRRDQSKHARAKLVFLWGLEYQSDNCWPEKPLNCRQLLFAALFAMAKSWKQSSEINYRTREQTREFYPVAEKRMRHLFMFWHRNVFKFFF